MSDPNQAVLTFQVEPDPCQVTGCNIVSQPVEVCRDHRCPHRWTREAAEDRQRRKTKDAKGKEDGKCL